VLTGFDDYPIHQASVPVACTASSDPNHYDRYFFNGYTRTGDLYFAAAMGLYPNRHVVDAAFSVVRNGEQHSVFASQRAPLDRAEANTVGPIVVEVLEPLRRLRLRVDAPQYDLHADVTFTLRSPAIEEPHFFQRVGQRVMMDYTRLTQFGSWSGTIECAGERIAVGDDVWGSRDRSWGIRPVGEPHGYGAPVGPTQFFWLWAPVNFPTMSTHFDVNEYSDGRRWHEVGAIAPVNGHLSMMRAVDWSVHWRPGTRWADSFEYQLIGWNDERHRVVLTPRYEFMMRGIGYGHPTHGHGTWQGETMVAGERLALPIPDACQPDTIHVQAICDAMYTSPSGHVEQGIGILEQLAIGPHSSGLTGLLDPS
jgi:hypothetical protein